MAQLMRRQETLLRLPVVGQGFADDRAGPPPGLPGGELEDRDDS
jgi:hypothetical protein